MSNSINDNKFAISVTFSEIIVLRGPRDYFVAEITFLALYS